MKRRLTIATAAAAATVAAAPAASAQLPASLPQVQTPQVQVPQVQTPQVQTPQVEVPQVRAPQVQASRSAPQLPKASAPSATQVRSAPSRGGAQSAGASSAGSSSSSQSAQSGGGSDPSSAPPAGSESSWGNGRSSSSGRASAKRRSPGERRDAAFRRAVRRLQGCLPGLGSFERRVLVRRAGIGGRPQSVGTVAHGLHVSVSRVRAAEGAGLAQLRRADRRVGCGAQGAQGGAGPRRSGVAKPSVGVAVAAGAAIVRTFNPVPRLASAIGRSKPRSPRQAQETQGIAGVQASSPKDDGLKLDRGSTRQGAATGSDFPLALILIAAAFLLLLPIAALTTLRRRAAATAGGEVATAPSKAEAQPKPERQAPPAPAPAAPPPVASQNERQPAVPQPGPSRRDTAIRGSRRVGSAVGAVGTRLSGGFRDLGRDVVRRARARRSRR